MDAAGAVAPGGSAVVAAGATPGTGIVVAGLPGNAGGAALVRLAAARRIIS